MQLGSGTEQFGDTMRSTLELGVVARAHGLHGAVKVQLHNPASTALEGMKQILLADGAGERLLGIRVLGNSGGSVVLEVEGVADRDAAEALRGARLLIDREALPALEEGEYYWQDLLGCQVEREDGRALGEVAEVFSAGASDVLVVRDGEVERLVPLVDDWVTEVDLAARRIRVRDADQFEPTKS